MASGVELVLGFNREKWSIIEKSLGFKLPDLPTPAMASSGKCYQFPCFRRADWIVREEFY